MVWGSSSQPAQLTLVALGAGLLFYLPARPTVEQASSDGGRERSAAFGDRLMLNCTSLGDLTGLEWLASGWTKAVYRGRFKSGRAIALKTVNLGGHDIESCLARGEAPSLARCYRRTSAKILRELILLQQLDHPNVIKVSTTNIPCLFGHPPQNNFVIMHFNVRSNSLSCSTKLLLMQFINTEDHLA